MSLRLEKTLMTAGYTLLVAFILCAGVDITSPTDTGQHGFGHGAIRAVFWLDAVWVVLALPVIVSRAKQLPTSFFVVFSALLVVLAICAPR